jgi:hypothetical protein
LPITHRRGHPWDTALARQEFELRMDYATVSQAVRRFGRNLRANARLRASMARIGRALSNVEM